VVKNAAGFDLPKLLVGSLGRLGVIVELSLKVLPAPPAYGTLRAGADGLEAGLEAVARLGRAGIDAEALDLEPSGRLWVRLGGAADGLERRLDRVARELGLDGERLLGLAEEDAWAAARDLDWAPPGASVAKVAITPARVVELDRALGQAGAGRRYSAGAQVCWVAWPQGEPAERLDRILSETGSGGVVITGDLRRPLIGAVPGGEFAARVRRGLDPDSVFAEI
jgi:glycolate oxidase FAD binding subunit